MREKMRLTHHIRTQIKADRDEEGGASSANDFSKLQEQTKHAAEKKK